MSKIKVADFYYGAVLSMLFNRHVNPVMVLVDFTYSIERTELELKLKITIAGNLVFLKVR